MSRKRERQRRNRRLQPRAPSDRVTCAPERPRIFPATLLPYQAMRAADRSVALLLGGAPVDVFESFCAFVTVYRMVDERTLVRWALGV